LTHLGDELNDVVEDLRDDEDGDPFGDCLWVEDPLLIGDAIEIFVERNNTTSINSKTNCCCLKCSIN
jgi:hypothetical protein